MKNYNRLKKIFEQYSQLWYAKRLLIWDEMVMMPQGAGTYRSQTIATCDQIMQQLLTTKKVYSSLIAVKQEALASHWDQKNLEWMEKKYKLMKCVPAKLIAKSTQANALAVQAWRKYREQNNWQDFMPYLHSTFQYIAEIAERKSQAFHVSPYEALINDFSPHVKENDIDHLIAQLKITIPNIRQAVMKEQVNETTLKLPDHFPVEKQKELIAWVVDLLGFDFSHGRVDTSHHPYCDGMPIDIRITTRYYEHNLMESLFGVIHETGHGLYEQGMPKEWVWQLVGQVQDKAVHESQALLFEYQLGHSYAFLQVISTKIRALFGNNPSLSPENLFKLINRICNGLIRLEADEISYVLHIILRYEIEKKLFAKEIEIKDLPAIWSEKVKTYFNLNVDGNYKDGVMQDIHWPLGYFGYFSSYLIGQLMAAQLYSVFLKGHPQFDESVKSGDLSLLRNWLKKNIYVHGSTLSINELLLKISGKPLDVTFFIQHIKKRYLLDSPSNS